MPSAYLAIGNSDDKLTQREWSEFIKEVDDRVSSMATEVHGRWFSAPDDPWQNACWSLHFKSDERLLDAARTIVEIRRTYKQESAAWTVAEPVFI